MNADPLPPLRDVIRNHGLTARRSLSQNFLLDLNLTRAIARIAAPLAALTVIEIGPGPGGLTRALLAEGAGRVIAIERDDRCLPALADIAAAWPGRLEIIAGDALALDLAALAGDGPVAVIANLPYGIATPLLIGLLRPRTAQDWPPWWHSLTLMFQREVADRIVAAPGSDAFGRLSVLAQWRSTPRIAMTLPPAAFTPPPKVASAVVHFAPRTVPAAAADAAALERVTAAAFGQRRKMLRAALRTLVANPTELLQRAGIDGARRAETLSIAEFCALATAFAGDQRGDEAIQPDLPLGR